MLSFGKYFIPQKRLQPSHFDYPLSITDNYMQILQHQK